MAKVCVGCGLTEDANGNLIVQTDAPTWPFTCSASAGGGQLYCDAGSGRLHAAPAIEAEVFNDAANIEFNAQQPIATFPAQTQVGTTAIVATMPGSCGQEVYRISEVEFQVDLTIPAGGRVRGYIAGDEMFDIRNTSNGTITIHSPQVTKTIPAMTTAGATAGQFNFQLSESGTNGATYDRVQWFYRIGAITTHTP